MRVLRVFLLPFAFLMAAIGTDSHAQHGIGTYYPLAKGNTWKYSVKESGRKVSYVIWTVTQETASHEGVVYQVWPHPMESDDDALSLLSSNSEVREFESKMLLVRNGLKPGESWELKVHGVVGRRLAVMESGTPCRGAVDTFPDCVAIEDVDERIHLRTLTHYAKGVGPVRIEYFKAPYVASTAPTSVVELLSYHVRR